MPLGEKDDNINRHLESSNITVEIPFTFDIPTEYEDFEKLLKSYDLNYHSLIIERMIKCNHPGLKSDHKVNLDLLFTYLLQHIQDFASDDSIKVLPNFNLCFENGYIYCIYYFFISWQMNSFKLLNLLAPWFFDLTQWNPQSCASSLIDVIKEKYKDFQKNPKCYPSLDTVRSKIFKEN